MVKDGWNNGYSLANQTGSGFSLIFAASRFVSHWLTIWDPPIGQKYGIFPVSTKGWPATFSVQPMRRSLCRKRFLGWDQPSHLRASAWLRGPPMIRWSPGAIARLTRANWEVQRIQRCCGRTLRQCEQLGITSCKLFLGKWSCRWSLDPGCPMLQYWVIHRTWSTSSYFTHHQWSTPKPIIHTGRSCSPDNHL